jgi:hypothetical protein
MENPADLLARYIDALSLAASTTHRAEERPVYQARLAAAAQMFAALHGGNLRALVATVNREGAGWTVAGSREEVEKNAALMAFESLARVVRSRSAT